MYVRPKIEKEEWQGASRNCWRFRTCRLHGLAHAGNSRVDILVDRVRFDRLTLEMRHGADSKTPCSHRSCSLHRYHPLVSVADPDDGGIYYKNWVYNRASTCRFSASYSTSPSIVFAIIALFVGGKSAPGFCIVFPALRHSCSDFFL